MGPAAARAERCASAAFVEPERFASEICELIRENPCAHQAIWRVSIRLKQKVADLVRHGAAEDDADPTVVGLRRMANAPPLIADEFAHSER